MDEVTALPFIEHAMAMSFHLEPWHTSLAYCTHQPKGFGKNPQENRVHLYAAKFITKDLNRILNEIKARKPKLHNVSVTGSDLKKMVNSIEIIKAILSVRLDEVNFIDSALQGFMLLIKNLPSECYSTTPNYQKSGSHFQFSNFTKMDFPCIIVLLMKTAHLILVETPGSYTYLDQLKIDGSTLTEKISTDLEPHESELTGLRSKLIQTENIVHESIQVTNYQKTITLNECKANQQLNNFSELLTANMATCVPSFVRQVVFGQCLTGDETSLIQMLSVSAKKASQGSWNPRFLRHDGLLGALGALLISNSDVIGRQDVSDFRASRWIENFAYSLPMGTSMQSPFGILYGQLALDKTMSKSLIPSHVINVKYKSTTQDFCEDSEARDYWLKCSSNSLKLGVESFINRTTDEARINNARKLFGKYKGRCLMFSQYPDVYGQLDMCLLLISLEQFRKEFGLSDTYTNIKKDENQQALGRLQDRLEYLDKLDKSTRYELIMKSVIVGNMYDWGSREAVTIMNANMDFEDIAKHVKSRPWVINHSQQWLDRMESHVYSCAAIFVDNCGADIVLGILPFARELLKVGTKVILCANSEPVLNDITHEELQDLLIEASTKCDVLKLALQHKKLIAMSSGQISPCLDLRRLDADLVAALGEVDLLVIEGMGRAIHSNLNAIFSRDCLWLALVKDSWMSSRLGSEGPFSIVFKFQRANMNEFLDS